eukprot:12165123-Heterocapsa_arctica.AAC.1
MLPWLRKTEPSQTSKRIRHVGKVRPQRAQAQSRSLPRAQTKGGQVWRLAEQRTGAAMPACLLRIRA